MARVVFRKGEQRKFIEGVEKVTGLNSEELGKLVGISGRSLRDWRSEKLLGSQKALLKLSDFSGISLPKILEVRPEYWSVYKVARKGALTRYRKYGNPGTLEGRRKGGRNSSVRALRRKIAYPEKSEDLVEFIGIMLGDGGITRKQISITLHSEDDREYFQFVFGLVKKLFKVEPGVYKRKDSRTICLQVSRMNLVDFLVHLGLKKGNKVKQGVDIPKWIKGRKKFEIACLRGLIDTDGGIFTHRYKVNGKLCAYKKMCFGSHSKPLLESVDKILSGLGFTPKIKKEDLYLYNEREVKRYFKEIGTHNPKHLRRFLD